MGLIKPLEHNQDFEMDKIVVQNLNAVKKKIKHDWDMAFIISGIEGGGKSTLAMQLAYFCSGDRFTIDHICFSPEDFMEKIKRDDWLKPGDSLILDEGFIVNSRATMTRLNRQFLSILAECRQKNLFLFIICPNFFDLDKNLALWRSRGMFYIYHKMMDRGFFKYYGYNTKKYLYIKGKKFYDYNSQKPDFPPGRFSPYVPIDHEEYKKAKLRAFQDRKPISKVEHRQTIQRNLLIRMLKEEFDVSFREIQDYFKKNEINLTESALRKAVMV